jgi:hypothetical protein
MCLRLPQKGNDLLKSRDRGRRLDGVENDRKIVGVRGWIETATDIEGDPECGQGPARTVETGKKDRRCPGLSFTRHAAPTDAHTAWCQHEMGPVQWRTQETYDLSPVCVTCSQSSHPLWFYLLPHNSVGKTARLLNVKDGNTFRFVLRACGDNTWCPEMCLYRRLIFLAVHHSWPSSVLTLQSVERSK